MPNRTWAFATDAQGLADAGNSANIAFAYEGSDGNPSGCVKFTTTATSLSNAVEKARRATAGETWETWGAASGSTVTQIGSISFDICVPSQAGLVGGINSVKVRIINSSGTTVLTGDLVNWGWSLEGTSWTTRASVGSTRNVSSAYQASTTDVRLELEFTVSTGASGVNIDVRLDNIIVPMVTTGGVITVSLSPVTINAVVQNPSGGVPISQPLLPIQNQIALPIPALSQGVSLSPLNTRTVPKLGSITGPMIAMSLEPLKA